MSTGRFFVPLFVSMLFASGLVQGQCVDGDGDGYLGAGWECFFGGPDFDCDDGDPRIHPGVPEICNNRDDDCDGLADLSAEYPDAEICPAAGWVNCELGADTNDGLTPATAWRTIQHGIAQVDDRGGGLLRLAPGICPSEGGVVLQWGVSLRGAGMTRTVIEDDLVGENSFGYATISDLAFAGLLIHCPSYVCGLEAGFLRVEGRAEWNLGHCDWCDPKIISSRLRSLNFFGIVYAKITLVDSIVEGPARLEFNAVSPTFFDIRDNRLNTLAIGMSNSMGQILRNTFRGGPATPLNLVVGHVWPAMDTTIANNIVDGGGADHAILIYGDPPFHGESTGLVILASNTIFSSSKEAVIIGAAPFRLAGNIFADSGGEAAVRASTYSPEVRINYGVEGNGFWNVPPHLLRLNGVNTDDPAALGPGNLVADPKFIDPEGGDRRLRFESPFIDALLPDWTDPLGSRRDRDGVRRPVDLFGRPDDRKFDAGAYEATGRWARECRSPVVPNDPGQCEAALPCSQVARCAGPGSENVLPVCTPGTPFPVGFSKVDVSCDATGTGSPVPCRVEVQDVDPPQGGITFPEDGACFGPASVPVVVADDFQDNCGEPVFRGYTPVGEVSTSAHGDHTVTLTAADRTGNAITSTVSFTIDLVAPLVTLTPEALAGVFPRMVPFPKLFRDADDDGAKGGIMHEAVTIDGCLAYDGATYGNRDGLLRDETVPATAEEVCRIARSCGQQEWIDPVIAVTVTDCGGNTATASARIPGHFGAPANRCP